MVWATWQSSPTWKGTDLSSQPSWALSPELLLLDRWMNHFSKYILQPCFELFQLKSLEQRWTSPTEPCPSFRFMTKISHHYGLNPLSFGVVCFTIMYSQDNTYICIIGQLSVFFPILRIRWQIRELENNLGDKKGPTVLPTTASKSKSMALVSRVTPSGWILREGLDIFPEIALSVVFRFAQWGTEPEVKSCVLKLCKLEMYNPEQVI